MKSPSVPCISSALALLLILPACEKKARSGAEYQTQTSEETAAAVVEAFAGDVNPPEKVDREIETLFLRLGQASRDAAPLETGRFFSIDAIIEAMDSDGMFEGFTTHQRREFSNGLRKGFANATSSIGQMAYDRHRIVRIEEPSQKMRVVFVQHYDTEMNITFPMRWWLAKTADGWRIFDYQDLSTGLRTVELMGLMIRAGIAKTPEPWVKAFLPIATRLRTLDISDPEQFSQLIGPLEELRRHEMPGMVRTFASMMMVGAFQATERIAEARAELVASRDGGYAGPMWHYQMAACEMADERHDEAIQQLEQHAGSFGWDSDSLEMLSDCHFQAGRMDEARAAALRGLDDSPGSASCLASLAAASTPEQLRDPATTAHFAANDNPEGAYELALDYLIELDATEKAVVLFEGFRAKFPESELIEYYVDELGLAAEKSPNPPND